MLTSQDNRRYALGKALESFEKHDIRPTTSAIVLRASAFEKYINSGYTPEEPKQAQDS